MDTDTRDDILAKLAYKCLRFGKTQEDRKLALEMVKMIKKNNVRWGEKNISTSDVVSMVKADIHKNVAIWVIERDYLRINQEAKGPGEKVDLKEPDKDKAIKALKVLNNIINNDKTDAYNKAYAHYVKALLLYALAKTYGYKDEPDINGTKIKAKDLYVEAMYELRATWEEALKHKGETHFHTLLKETFEQMVGVVDGVIHTKTGNKSARKAFVKELAEFVPKYDSTDIEAYAFNARANPEKRTPTGYRKALKKKFEVSQKNDSFKTYKPKLGEKTVVAAKIEPKITPKSKTPKPKKPKPPKPPKTAESKPKTDAAAFLAKQIKSKKTPKPSSK
jgi:hypothetical protein